MHLGRLHWFRVKSDLNLDTNAANRHKHVSITVLAQDNSNTTHVLSKTHFQAVLIPLSSLLLTLHNSAAVNATRLNAILNAQQYAAVNAAVNATVNAQGAIAVNTSQSTANLFTDHFNDTCPLGDGQKRLRRRSMTDFDVGCVENSVFSLARYVATSSAVQKDLSSIPSNFRVKGQLITVVNQVKVRVQEQPQLFPGRLFSPIAIFSTLSYLSTLAYVVWEYGPGTEITHIVIPSVDVEAASPSSSGCSSWTFSFTSPTPSTTVVVSLTPLLTSLGSNIP